MSRARFLASLVAAVVSGCIVLPDQLAGLSSLTPGPAASGTAGNAAATASPAPAGIPTSAGRLTPGGNSGQSTLRGPIFGLVTDEQGKPRAGVTVSAYSAIAHPLVNSGNPLIGANGGALIGNVGAGLIGGSGGAYRIQADATESLVATTNDAGAYVLTPPATGFFSVVADASPNSKAYRQVVAYNAAGSQNDAGELKLGPTGSIKGKVKSADPQVTNFLGVRVFIPGTSFNADAAPDGSYVISSVPEGKFILAAYSYELGVAVLPNKDFEDPVEVVRERTTQAPPLVLTNTPPEIASVKRVEDGEGTDNGAPGSRLILSGKHFGASNGYKLEVLFNGAPAIDPARKSDIAIEATIPYGALNGNLLVKVTGLLSNPVAFRVIDKVTVKQALLQLSVGHEKDLAALLDVRDSKNVGVAEFRDGATIKAYRPNLTYQVQSPYVGVSAAGILKALSSGEVTVNVKAGTLISESLRVQVFDGPVPTVTTPPPPPPTQPPYKPTKVLLDRSSVTLNAMPPDGKPDPGFVTATLLKATILPAGDTQGVLWTVADDSLVGVDQTGKVTAKAINKVGSTQVTATSLADPNLSASCTVNITIKAGINVGVE
jgi:hypothetical protein